MDDLSAVFIYIYVCVCWTTLGKEFLVSGKRLHVPSFSQMGWSGVDSPVAIAVVNLIPLMDKVENNHPYPYNTESYYIRSLLFCMA